APHLSAAQGRGHRAILVHQPRADDLHVLQGPGRQPGRAPGGQHADRRRDRAVDAKRRVRRQPDRRRVRPGAARRALRGGRADREADGEAAAPRGRRPVRHAALLSADTSFPATVTARPEFDGDLYSDAAIGDPYPLYRTLRDLGPAVWLRAHGAWAIARFDDVRTALRADRQLVSGRGVAMNDMVNGQVARVTLTTDGDLHRQLRATLMKPMMPSALREVEAEVQTLADELVTRLAARDSFDGIADFARHLPVAVVSRLVGLPEEGRQRMLDWAAATFDVLGPMNARAQAAAPIAIREMAKYASQLTRERLRPDGWAARL